MGRVITAAVVGAIIAFVWGAVSWMALPFHSQTLHEFKGESIVATSIKAAVDKAGIYIIPYCQLHKPESKNLGKEEKKAIMEETQAKIKEGPYVFMSILPDGDLNDMKTSMMKNFVVQLVVALMLGLLLSQSSATTYLGRVVFIAFAATAGAIAANMPNVIWWGFPCDFVMLNILDITISWFLAGLAMAKIID